MEQGLPITLLKILLQDAMIASKFDCLVLVDIDIELPFAKTGVLQSIADAFDDAASN